MEKPIIATTLSGLFVKSEPWENAHLIWYDEREKELEKKDLDTSIIKEWRRLLQENPEEERKRYFEFVDGVMKKLYPKLSEEERTKKARESYFEATIKYIEQNPNVVNEEVIRYFESIKDKYRLGLITTNTKSALERILKVANLKNLFDLIETSKPEEKDVKEVVFDRFIKKHGKPLAYIGGGRKDSYDHCKNYGIRRVFANLEEERDLEDVENVHNLRELKQKISELN